MNIAFNSRTTLHLSVSPSVKSWSIFFGILSVGIGASYYSPDEHVLMKILYMSGCLFLGLTFLDEWEDCVIDQIQKKITLTRRNWFEILTSRCTSSKTLVLDTSSVMGVRIIPAKRNKYKAGLLLRSGSVIPISETTSNLRGEEEEVASCVKRILGLERVEALRGELFEDSDDDNQSTSTSPDVESLQRSAYINYDDVKFENDENDAINHGNDDLILNEDSDHSDHSDHSNRSSTDEDNGGEF